VLAILLALLCFPKVENRLQILRKRKSMRYSLMLTGLTLVSAIFSGCATAPEKLGLAYRGETRAENVHFLVDETWVDTNGLRQVDQEIFASVHDMIDEAERFVLLDLFLLNDWGYVPGPGLTPLSQELTDRLLEKRAEDPGVEIVFITDPVNSMYGSIASPQFQAMEAAGIQVVWTDLDKLPDSNPLYSKPWRVFAKPFGTGPGRTLPNPMGEGRVSMRSILKLLNFKANHRKVVVTDKSLLLTSANPHSASSAHWNVALRVDGAGQELALEAESAIMAFSGVEDLPALEIPASGPEVGNRIELLTEGRIKEKLLALLADAEPGARIDLCMFYLSEKQVVQAFIDAKERACDVRVILDPSKDAFGRKKNGVPNRQSSAKLVKGGIPLRWTETHGEQCHVKMVYVEHSDQTATLMLGSSNFTRRNMNNLNCEANLAFTAPVDHPSLQRARETFDRWWTNADDRLYTVDYETYRDGNLWRGFLAWWMENTGMGTF
jgi:hypothetical protein